MPDEDKNFGDSLVLDFRKRWRHVRTIYDSRKVLPCPICHILQISSPKVLL